jgi:hypothetical protein
LADSTGKIIWRRDTDDIGGIAICGDTIVTGELVGKGQREWKLVRYQIQDGKRMSRADIGLKDGNTADVRLLGCVADGAVLEVYARGSRHNDAPVQRYFPFPELSALVITAKGQRTSPGFTVVDSTPQYLPPFPAQVAMPIRAPFAPRFSVRLSSSGNLLFATGADTVISVRSLGGQSLGTVRLAGGSVERTDSQIAAFRADWVARNARTWSASLRPETLFTRIAQLETSARGRTLGNIVTSHTGDALVHRRDLDRQLLDTTDPKVYDIFAAQPNGVTRGRLSLPPRHVVLAFDGSRILTWLASTKSGTSWQPGGEVFLFRIEGPAAR